MRRERLCGPPGDDRQGRHRSEEEEPADELRGAQRLAEHRESESDSHERLDGAQKGSRARADPQQAGEHQPGGHESAQEDDGGEGTPSGAVVGQPHAARSGDERVRERGRDVDERRELERQQRAREEALGGEQAA